MIRLGELASERASDDTFAVLYKRHAPLLPRARPMSYTPTTTILLLSNASPIPFCLQLGEQEQKVGEAEE